jgi:tetratricopeptide (TPR) repeat protein
MNENERIAASLQQLNRSAVTAITAGEVAEGRELFRKALAFEEQLGFVSHSAETLINIATASLLLEDYAAALAAVDEALELFRNQHRLDDQRRALSLQGEILLRCGRTAEAALALESALRLSPAPVERASLYYQAAIVYRSQEQQYRAQEYLGRALADFDRMGNQQGTQSCLRERANLFAASGRHDLAARDRYRYEQIKKLRPD